MFSFFKRKKKPETPETAPEQNAQPPSRGLGPFPVPGDPLTQDDVLTVDVREARALLVG